MDAAVSVILEDVDEFWAGRDGAARAQDDVPQAYVHNLVGTARVDTNVLPISLDLVGKMVPGMQYDKQKFAAITLRLAQPSCTVLLFTSGKMVLTGCRNYVNCILAAHHVLAMLRRGFVGQRFDLKDVCIQNIVGNSHVPLTDGESMDLDRMLEEKGVYCTYLKNMFPGLIYRPPQSPVVLLVFKSGKVVITGGKTMHDIDAGWRMLWPDVRQYVDRSTTRSEARDISQPTAPNSGAEPAGARSRARPHAAFAFSECRGAFGWALGNWVLSEPGLPLPERV